MHSRTGQDQRRNAGTGWRSGLVPAGWIDFAAALRRTGEHPLDGRVRDIVPAQIAPGFGRACNREQCDAALDKVSRVDVMSASVNFHDRLALVALWRFAILLNFCGSLFYVRASQYSEDNL